MCVCVRVRVRVRVCVCVCVSGGGTTRYMCIVYTTTCSVFVRYESTLLKSRHF